MIWTNKRYLYLLIIPILIKSILASTTELTNDEAYYWTYAQHLQWSYFDHPPMIALMIRLSTFNLLQQHEFFLRLGPMLCSAISTYLIYLIGKHLKNSQTGFFSALLFIASPYCSLIAGCLLIPDAPALMFWLWSVLLMIRIIMRSQQGHRLAMILLTLGFAIGCSIFSKVSGVFLWFGFGLYIVLYQRNLLRNPFLYLSVFITLIFIGCIVYWNYNNQFITYTYHSSRVSFFGSLQWDSFFRELFGEIGYNNPIIFFLIISAIVGSRRNMQFIGSQQQQLVFSLSFPLILIVLFLSLFRDTLPHWNAPGYSTLIPFAAAWLQERNQTKSSSPIAIKFSLGLIALLLITSMLLIHWLPVSLGKSNPEHLGAGDVTLDNSGFSKFSQQFDSLYLDDRKKQIMKPGAFVISDYWFPAGHLDYYLCHRYKINFLAIGSLTSIHNYAWLNLQRPFLKEADDAYLIIVSNYANPPAESLTQHFEKILTPTIIPQLRGGKPVRNFIIYRLKNYKGHLPRNGVL